MSGRQKRWRTPQAKPGQLLAAWGKNPYDTSRDLIYSNGGEGVCRADMRVLMAALEESDVFDGKSLRKVLEERGYDLTTLKFSIQKAPTQ